MKEPLQQSVKLANITPWGNYANRPPDEEFDSSIKTKGVLQPVILRFTKKEEFYELIAGKRRFLSSTKAGYLQIPAMISEMTDEEAAEVQLIENLQRVDVHPMQEAKAFKTILEAGKKTIEVIASHIAKSPTYVARRLKLNDVIPEYQKAFERNQLNVSQMEKIFQLPQVAQKKMFVERHKSVGETNQFSFNNNMIQSYFGDLTHAPFDLNDETLDSKMGACSKCPNNTSLNATLFPVDEVKATCGLISCFANKCRVNYDIRLTESLNDPAIELIDENYQLSDESKVLIKKHKCKILTSNQFSELRMPTPPDVYVETPFDPLECQDQFPNYANEKEWREMVKEEKKDYDEEVADYKKELKEYNDMIASGKFTKAFIVEGSRRGFFVRIQIAKTRSNGSSQTITKAELQKKISENKVSKENLGSEINRIKDKQKRNRELDEEKISPLIYDALDKDSVFNKNSKALMKNEKIALLLAMNQTIFDLKKLNKLTPGALDSELWKSCRQFFMGSLSRQQLNREKNDDVAIIEEVALDYIPTTAKKIRDEQMSIRKIREDKADKAITDLKKKIAEIQPSANKKVEAKKKK